MSNKQNQSDATAHPVDTVVMHSLPESVKKLVLHTAYFSFMQQEWKHKVLQADIQKEVKLDLIRQMPCGDAIDNLMRVAEMILQEYDGNKTINEIIKLVRDYTYPFERTA